MSIKAFLLKYIIKIGFLFINIHICIYQLLALTSEFDIITGKL